MLLNPLITFIVQSLAELAMKSMPKFENVRSIELCALHAVKRDEFNGENEVRCFFHIDEGCSGVERIYRRCVAQVVRETRVTGLGETHIRHCCRRLFL